jgi:hypothetical protein
MRTSIFFSWLDIKEERLDRLPAEYANVVFTMNDWLLEIRSCASAQAI